MNTVSLSAAGLRAVRTAWMCGTAGALVTLAIGCNQASTSSVKNPTDTAAELVRTQCGAVADEAALAPVLDGSAVESVEPLYYSIQGGTTGRFSELSGSAITVRALRGMTAQWLTRALECHSARRVLAGLPSAGPSDPFWLPGGVVDIEARSAHDSFRVEVRAADPVGGQQVLDRARAFARGGSAAASL